VSKNFPIANICDRGEQVVYLQGVIYDTDSV